MGSLLVFFLIDFLRLKSSPAREEITFDVGTTVEHRTQTRPQANDG